MRGRRGQAKCIQHHQVRRNDEPRVETCLEDADKVDGSGLTGFHRAAEMHRHNSSLEKNCAWRT